MFKSIRHGLFAALAGFALLICLCYTGLALVIAYVTEDMLVDRLLEREAAAVSAQFARSGAVPPSGHDWIRAYRGVAALPPAVREQVAAGRERAEIPTDTGQHYHLRTLDLAGQSGPQRLYLLADVRPLLVVSKLVQEVGGVLIAVALGLVALALLLAYLLSRRLVSPLQVLAREVRSVPQEGTMAFSARHRRDEIGYLANKLGATMDELRASLQREQAFTRDVSHELRTPLTVMNNVLGQASGPLDAHEAAQLRTGLEDIGHTIDILFALARAEHIAHETVDLRGCIEETLLRLLDEGARNGEGLALERLALGLPDRLTVLGNRHLAALLVNNCLGNAVFHGGPGARLALSFADGVLAIENTVDPDRAKTMQGFLHGQHLLLRIATAMGWTIRFQAGAAAYRVEMAPAVPPGG